MQSEAEFRNAAAAAMEALKQHLIAREDEAEAGFEIEHQNGVLSIVFRQPRGKFVLAPKDATRQLSLSAEPASFELDWDAAARQFVLPRTGEALLPLVDRLIEEHREP